MSKMDMNKLMQQAQQMQSQMQQLQEEAANEIVEASAGGGMVTVTADGRGKIRSIRIDPTVVDPADVETWFAPDGCTSAGTGSPSARHTVASC